MIDLTKSTTQTMTMSITMVVCASTLSTYQPFMPHKRGLINMSNSYMEIISVLLPPSCSSFFHIAFIAAGSNIASIRDGSWKDDAQSITATFSVATSDKFALATSETSQFGTSLMLSIYKNSSYIISTCLIPYQDNHEDHFYMQFYNSTLQIPWWSPKVLTFFDNFHRYWNPMCLTKNSEPWQQRTYSVENFKASEKIYKKLESAFAQTWSHLEERLAG